MFMFFRSERPTSATLRSFAIATSAACCMRWMFEAKLAIEDASRAHRDQLAERLADEALGAGHPGALGVRRVAEHEVDAAVADLGELADVGLEAVDRRVVELPVARVQHAPGRRLDDDRDAVGDRVGHPDELELERAELHRRRRPGRPRASVVVAPRPCSSSFDFTIASVSLVPITSPDLDLAQDVRQRADVVLVAVREHDREQRPVLEVREVGQDEVDAEVLVAREREARRRSGCAAPSNS